MLRLKYLNREQIVFPESHDTPITGYERKTSLHANVSIFFPAPVGQRAKKKKRKSQKQESGRVQKYADPSFSQKLKLKLKLKLNLEARSWILSERLSASVGLSR